MTDRICLSIDGMGGDDAPAMVIDGMAHARRILPHVDFLLFGDEAQLRPLIDQHADLSAVTEIRHTQDVVSNEEKPGIALRSGRNSSMRLAINAVHTGEAAGIISAGNTGALMAMAKFVLKTLPGIDRPAIATTFPTMRGQCVMLDLGANIECDSDNLVQFAVMGEVFARNVLGLKQPSVGILNVGVEVLKGNDAVKQAAFVLENTDLPIDFVGFVEGDGISKGAADVIVTDGFTGNIALKTMEGTAKLFASFLKESLMSTFVSKLGALLASPGLNKLKARLDPRRYNGAMFLGLNGICIKSHGGTDFFGFSNAIQVAEELVKDELIAGIKADFDHITASDALNGQAK